MKRNKIEFVKSVVDSLDYKPRNILEIANLAGTSWESTKNLLIELSESGLIKSTKDGNRSKFYRKEALVSHKLLELKVSIDNIIDTLL